MLRSNDTDTIHLALQVLIDYDIYLGQVELIAPEGSINYAVWSIGSNTGWYGKQHKEAELLAKEIITKYEKLMYMKKTMR